MYQVGAQQGWQCPLCKKIYGPFVQECFHCNNQETTITTTVGDDPNAMGTVTINGEQIGIENKNNSLTIDWTKHESTTYEKHIPQIY